MRLILSIIFTSLILAEDSCRERAKLTEKLIDDLKINAYMKKYECSRDEIYKKWANMTMAGREKMFNIIKQNKNNEKMDHVLCRRFQEKYAPFGFADKKPQSLVCDKMEIDAPSCAVTQEFNPECEKRTDKTDHQLIDQIDGEKIPNIVILGQTGSGKSYFANGLIGYQDPDSGPFATGDSSRSCTRMPKGVHADFFDNNLISYGVENMKMNVFDTPGFGDSDSCQLEENKRRIANEFSKEIDAFIFLLKHENPRFDQTMQKTLQMLNEWTMGTIWQNMIFVYPRVQFTNYARFDRLNAGTTWYRKIKEKRDQMIEDLYSVSQKEDWQIRNVTDGTVRKMIRSDFENIRTNALNVHQNKLCRLSMGGLTEGDLCWKRAKLNQDNDYDLINPDDCWLINDPNQQIKCLNSDDSIKTYDNEFILTDEARKIQSIIKEFMNHPVIPQKLYWKQQLDKDLDSFNRRWADFHNFSNQTLDDIKSPDVDTTKCDEEYSETIQTIEFENIIEPCPYWGKWEDGQCNNKCGYGTLEITRKCYISNQETSTKDCEFEFPEDMGSLTTKACANLRKCGWNDSTEDNPHGWVKDERIENGECSQECGTGFQSYYRICDGPICDGPTTKIEPCNTHFCKLSSWTKWSQCSTTCGTGNETWIRRCLGSKCDPNQPLIERRKCHVRSCPSYASSGYLRTYYDGREVEFGCHKGSCFSYCGADWTSGEWCYTNGSCNEHADCNRKSAYEYGSCSGSCTL
jgi:energy-coupling factor transporter ATP-binding protein EcfA2